MNSEENKSEYDKNKDGSNLKSSSQNIDRLKQAEKESDLLSGNSEEEKRQRKWEEAEKQQEKNALRPGIDKEDMDQHDEQGNPKEF